MKIVKHGWDAEDGIHITCRCCKCEFVIEDRNDFDVEEVVEVESLRHYMEYNFQCPECHYADSLGIDPNLYLGRPYVYSKNPVVFERKDWKERYEVKYREQ